MTSPSVAPLNAFGRISRSIVIVALLLGNLFPQIPDFPVPLIAAVLAAVLIAYDVIRWLPKLHPVIFVGLFFGMFALHAMYIAPANAYGEDKLQNWMTSTLLSALVACLLRDARSFQTLGLTWLISGSGLAVFTLLGYDGGRADTFGANPIWLARAMASGALIAIWMLWKRLVSVWVALPVVALLVSGLVASGSRGPVIAVLVGVVVLSLYSGRGRIWRVLAILVGGLLAVWAVQVLPFFAGNRFESLLGASGTDNAGRLYYWEISWPIIRQHPLGVGFGNWNAAAGNPRHLWPHNLLLEIFAEMGVFIGTITVLMVLVIMILLIRRAGTNPVALLVLALLSAEIVNVNVSGDLNARTFWFLLACAYLICAGAVASTPLRGLRRFSIGRVPEVKSKAYDRAVRR